MGKWFILFIVFLCFGKIVGQLDHTPLISSGEVPSDFMLSTEEKIKSHMSLSLKKGFEKQKEKKEIEKQFYADDELLNSGLVLYGDEVSNYVKDIADNLLASEPELFEKLDFFTLKLNESSIFVNHNGKVFVSVGLVAQLENRDQLAYLLAHEIAHFALKHKSIGAVTPNYGKIDRKQLQVQVNQMSRYSIGDAYNADDMAMGWFAKGGFSSDEILNALDILLYSHLTFDNKVLTVEYFNEGLTYIPSSQFPKEARPVSLITNDQSTPYPNLIKRRSRIALTIKNNVANDVSSISNRIIDYAQISRISRFETLRNNLYDFEYGKALYSIFLLEEKFPNSLYLAQCKAKSWLGLSQFKAISKFNVTVERRKNLEGESARMHLFLYSLDLEGLMAMSLRQITDILAVHKNDKTIILIYERIVQLLAEQKDFSLARFKQSTFSSAADSFYSNLLNTDSVQKKDAIIEQKVTESRLSRYERLKNNKRSKMTESNVFDSTSYVFYLIPDQIADPNFREMFDNYQISNDSLLRSIEALNSKRKDYRMFPAPEQKLSIGINDFILVEPSVTKYRAGKIDFQQSDKLAKKFSDATVDASKDLDMNAYVVDKTRLNKVGTTGYNERACLMQLLDQITNAEGVNVFPVDFEFLEDIQINYNTSKVVFTIIETSYDIELSNTAYYGLVLFPVGMVYFPYKALTGNQTRMNMVVLDIEKGRIIAGERYDFNQAVTQPMLKARIYDVLFQLKQKPSNL